MANLTDLVRIASNGAAVSASPIRQAPGVSLCSTVLGATLLWSTAVWAGEANEVDCPLRDESYSITTPVMDILLKPEAVEIADRHMDGAVSKLPEFYASKEPPSFSAIINLQTIAALAGLDPSVLPMVDAELAALEVTDADRQARCARYDTVTPALVIPEGKPRLLLFEKINGFKDTPSFDAAHALLLNMADEHDWNLVVTDNGAAFTPELLAHFDAVIWNNISGDVLTLSQRRAFKDYIHDGGGFVGIHGSGGDPDYIWDWYVDELIGARFMGHPRDPQFQEARIVVENNQAGIGQGLPANWVMNEEWYSFKNSPRDKGAVVVASLDEASYEPVGHGGQDLRMGDHPIAWSRCIGAGRSFYSAIGHRPEVYADPNHQKLLQQAITWVVNQNSCAPGRSPQQGK